MAFDFDLTGKKISETYQRVIQYDTGSMLLYDGLGNKVAVSGSTLSAISASLAELAKTASYSLTAGDYDQRLNSITGSYATTGSNIFVDNQVITGSLYVSSSIYGNVIKSNKTITSNYNVQLTDNVIFANTTSPFSASLFDATQVNGTTLVFKVIGNHNLTIQPQSGQKIDEYNNLIISDKFVSVELISSGSNWYII